MTKDELASWWRWFAESECRGYSPLYETICAAVAGSDDVLDYLLTVPSHAQQPNLLLAAVHDRVLQGLEPELADCYDRRDTASVGALFARVVSARREALRPVLEARRVQTNEIGRVAVIAAALAALDLSEPPTLLDVGTSAGLTLTLDRCRIDFGPHGAIGPADSAVQVVCDVLHGSPPVRSVEVAASVGFDRNPLDPTDEADFRWLLACTWPDTGRIDRARAVLELAAAHPAVVHRGDAVDDLPGLLDRIAGPLVVTTTWVVGYLSPAARREVAELLAATSVARPVWWISAESRGVVTDLPDLELPPVDGASPSALGVVEFRDGAIAAARLLAHVQNHGQWIWWYDG